MEYLYAAMLLHAAGKDINEENLTKVLEAPGIKPDKARIKALVAALEGVDIDEAIKQATVTPVAAAPAEAPAEAPAPEEKKEEKKEKEEEKEEVSEEEAIEGLGALFG